MAVAVAQNIGPVTRAEIPIPESGGVVVFRGRNGSGKSTMLNAIDAAVAGGGRTKIPVRDGALKAEFEGFGVRLTVGRSTRRSGEAEVHTLEGRLSVADLVDPGIIDPEKADAYRIKALVNLVAANANESLFHSLVGAEAFAECVSPASLTHDDLVSMAAAIKRDFESVSRRHSSTAENYRVRAMTLRRSAEGVDLTAECDGSKLQASLEEAIATKAAMESQAKQHALSRARVAEAKSKLATLEAKAVSIDARAAEELEAMQKYEATMQSLADAEIAVRKLRVETDKAKAAYEAAVERRRHAEEISEAIEACRQQASAESVPPVDPAELSMATAGIESIRNQIEQAGVIRKALEAIAKAEQMDAEAKRAQDEADRLRAAAKGVDDVLSFVVAQSGIPLRIEPVDQRMRLVIDTHRGRTCFGELSEGERWRLALEIAIKAVGPGGELTIPQTAWEGLDPANRKAIAEQAVAGRVVIYTAEAAEGELRAEVMEVAA